MFSDPLGATATVATTGPRYVALDPNQPRLDNASGALENPPLTWPWTLALDRFATSPCGSGASAPGGPSALVLTGTFAMLVDWRRTLRPLIALPRSVAFLVPTPPG